MGGDGVQAGSTTGVAARDNETITNRTPRREEEAGCGVVNGATEWGGAGATVACVTEATGRDASAARVTRYGGAATNEAGAEHPLPLCGHCMCTMVMRVNGYGILAHFHFRVRRTC